jgi:hypothetical protein
MEDDVKWENLEIEAAAVLEEISDHVKCTKQFAQNVEKNAKFLSSQQKASQYFAKNVI